MNDDPQWVCERAFTPWIDFEAELRKHSLPLYSLETFTPLHEFDVIGFTLQYEVCYTNLLTMLDLGRIPLHSKDRTMAHPLVIAGGPGAQNPELLAPFVDLFVIGDGEESLPYIMKRWMEMKEQGRLSRADMIADIAGSVNWAYAPMFYEPEYHGDGTIAAMHRTRAMCRRRSWPAPSTRTSTIFHCRKGRLCHSSRPRTTASPSRSCAVVLAVPFLSIDGHQAASASALLSR